MAYSPMGGGLGFVLVLLVYAVLAFVLYLIIRFGVKHGMRSYYEESRRNGNPPE